MFASFESLYPLLKVSHHDLSSLCEALWNWRPCSDWEMERACQQRLKRLECPCRRAEILTPFFDFYKDITAYYVPELTGNSVPALKTHGDVIRIIECIKTNPGTARLQLTKEHFSRYMPPSSRGLPSNDQNRAFGLAVRILTMLQCSVEDQPDGLLESGSQPAIWRSDQSFNQFINLALPRRNKVSFELQNENSPSVMLPPASITAKRLKRVAKMRMVPTDDLRNHLLLDEKNGTLAVYHYTSVLKEHLKSSEEPYPSTSSRSSTYKYANIPRQLAMETLNTLKYVLFPAEAESQTILRSLVARDDFDPDNCRVDTSSWLPLEGEPNSYEYWGARLMRLYDELENPTPRGVLESWLERRSGARYVMLVTLVGVLIAILPGIFSLAVSVFQAWISWQQWQHPISE
ncbi:hypothetical protein F5Y13DRAFT_158548 [Hypoxylon sp. FL1857]|nr:hypothetical protein F5Y13DRAFT_158548 [Hypoxylon sp. FL1857]